VNNIKIARVKKGLTTKELAALVGVSTSAVSQWESGGKQPRADKLDKMSAILGVSTDYLLGKKEDPVQSEDKVESLIFDIVRKMSPQAKNRLLSNLLFHDDLTANQEE